MPLTLSLSGKDWQIMGLPPSEWEWRRLGETDADLDSLSPWFPATVPGDVQSDLIEAGVIPDFRFGRNSPLCEWTSSRDWVCRKEFDAPPSMRGKRAILLRFAGVDFACHVFLNGIPLGDHVGMVDPFAFDVTALLRWDAPNRLLVVIEHAPVEPEVQGQIGRTSQIRLWKPRFAYGWNGFTRLIPLGVWQEVTLEADDGARIEEVWARPVSRSSLEDAPFAQARVDGHIRIHADAERRAVLRLTVSEAGRANDPQAVANAETVALHPGDRSVTLSVSLSHPRLWHPNNLGAQALYEARVVLETPEGELLDERVVRFGFRAVRFLLNEDAPSPPADALSPPTDAPPPYTLEINGARTYILGWNWVPLDQLYGRPQPERVRHLLEMAKAAHCNLLRVWGGGPPEREIFYDLCDELGILVWQEFMQTSSAIDSEPGADPDYLSACRAQAEKLVAQKRNHPCLLLWCGGFELATSAQVPLTSAHPTLAALKEVTHRLDPDRAFLPTAPYGPTFAASTERLGRMHIVHGPWNYLGDHEHYRFYNAIDPLLHAAFSVEGAANIEALPRFLPPAPLWPREGTNQDWTHHGAGRLHRAEVEQLFGPLETVKEFVQASQWLQAEGLRYALESHRRQQGRASGALPWSFNESWPNAIGASVLDYYGQPKPAYYWARRACAPLLLSAQYARLQWEPGALFEAEIWLSALAEARREFGGKARVQWRIVDVATWSTLFEDYAVAPLAAAERPLRMVTIRRQLPADYRGVFALQLNGSLEGQSSWESFDSADAGGLTGAMPVVERNEYLFSTRQDAPFAPLMNLPTARLRIQRLRPRDNQRVLSVHNVGETPALCLLLSLPDAPLGVRIDSAYRTLAPREQRWFRFSGETLPDPLRVSLAGWNIVPRRLQL